MFKKIFLSLILIFILAFFSGNVLAKPILAKTLKTEVQTKEIDLKITSLSDFNSWYFRAQENIRQKELQPTLQINSNNMDHVYDLDSNVKLSSAKWTASFLSEQIFGTIFISKAFKLNPNEEILEDIYGYVKKQDNNWITLHDKEYIRVTFEKKLDKTNDITVYAKPVNLFKSGSIEVYPIYENKDGDKEQGAKLDLVSDQKYLDFSNIDHKDFYRIILKDLQKPTDTFDLKIMSTDLDFDYIVDPEIPFNKHIIGGGLMAVIDMDVIDIDGDGDIDVLGTNAFTSEDVTWWKNDGSENFTKHTIDGSADDNWEVYATDVDGDGDIDVLGAAQTAGDIIWWENDGSENFTEHTIDGSTDINGDIYATDVDGDGDIDVLGAAGSADEIAWWENDGSENFTKHTIDGSFDGAFSIYATDVDGDGDIDVLGAAQLADEIAWWENDGSENFTKHTIDGSFDFPISIHATDVDGDGDIDVLGANFMAGEFAWWENTTPDTTPPVLSNFSPVDFAIITNATQTITFDTNENAICKVSLTDQPYADMSGDTCSGAGTTSQSCTTPNLGTDGEKSVYIACTDGTNEDTAETNEDLTYTLDTTNPTISEVSANPSSTTAAITWMTNNEDSSSQLEYGLVSSYGSNTDEIDISPRVSSHSVSLTNLKSCSKYYYRVKSKDNAGNQSVSSQSTFYTTGCQVSTISIGESDNVETSGGTISLTTDNGTATVIAPDSFYSETTIIQIGKLESTTIPTSPSGTSLVNDNYFNLLATNTSGEALSSFDQSVSFVIAYGSEVELSFQENTFDVYKYTDGAWVDKNCILDTVANTLTCSLSGFSTYAVFGEKMTTGNSNNDTNSNSISSSQSCFDPKPAGTPDLFWIDTNQTQATLYFTPITDNKKYYISFSTNENAEEHGVEVNLESSGVQNYTINLLSPNTTYYFKVRGQNGCMPGDWSNVRSGTTKILDNILISKIKETLKQTFDPEKEIEIVSSELTSKLSSVCSYTVSQGDSLWGIAEEQFGDGFRFIDLMELNQLSNNFLEVGQELQLPCDKKEETLTKAQEELNQEGIKLDILVKDSNNNPISGAFITLHSRVQQAKTDKEGIARFENVEPGDHKAIIAYNDYQGEKSFTVDEAQKEQVLTLQVNLKQGVSWPIFLVVIGLLGIIILALLSVIYRKNSRK